MVELGLCALVGQSEVIRRHVADAVLEIVAEDEEVLPAVVVVVEEKRPKAQDVRWLTPAVAVTSLKRHWPEASGPSLWSRILRLVTAHGEEEVRAAVVVVVGAGHAFDELAPR